MTTGRINQVAFDWKTFQIKWNNYYQAVIGTITTIKKRTDLMEKSFPQTERRQKPQVSQRTNYLCFVLANALNEEQANITTNVVLLLFSLVASTSIMSSCGDEKTHLDLKFEPSCTISLFHNQNKSIIIYLESNRITISLDRKMNCCQNSW
jgi:hypothetical protein